MSEARARAGECANGPATRGLRWPGRSAGKAIDPVAVGGWQSGTRSAASAEQSGAGEADEGQGASRLGDRADATEVSARRRPRHRRITCAANKGAALDTEVLVDDGVVVDVDPSVVVEV